MNTNLNFLHADADLFCVFFFKKANQSVKTQESVLLILAAIKTLHFDET